MNKHHYVAIMAGGIGSRFWPVSRARLPKQFLDILNTGDTLIQATYKRFSKFIPAENIYVVTSDEYTSLVKEQLPAIPHENILAEPSRKNTAPCVAYISFKLHQIDPQASFVVAPSDQLILDTDNFADVCKHALNFVDHNDSLLTLGIKPTYPNTGYGYIQYEPTAVADNIFPVKVFTEKPSLELAKAFIASGDFLWNAGIFAWRASVILDEFERYLPEMHELFATEKHLFGTADEKAAIDRIYPQCVNISIDYGIMEKAKNVNIIPSSFGWSDLGTWNSAYENMDKDENANAIKASNVLLVEATGNLVHAENNKMVVLQGLEDFVVVDTSDVLLICRKEKEQEIKEYMAEVKKNKGERFL
jgi:mannose-1-phosphate guanylyltransferase